MRLRDATTADAAAILAVHRAAIEGVDPDVYTAAQLAAWKAAQDDPDQYPIGEAEQYLAVAEDEQAGIVGFVGLDLEEGVLETLYVDPEFGGKGVGSALLDHGEKVARRHDHDAIAMAASQNATAFYERHGYVEREETFALDMGEETLEFVRMDKSFSE